MRRTPPEGVNVRILVMPGGGKKSRPPYEAGDRPAWQIRRPHTRGGKVFRDAVLLIKSGEAGHDLLQVVAHRFVIGGSLNQPLCFGDCGG
jgi:hypothetical protein